MREKQNRQRQEPISLLKLVTLGVTSSILVVGGLFLLFAAYESQTWLFWTAEEHLSPDTLFGVGRNAVTLAAALGVGVTLFFSYRKQQTAEKAQELATMSQKTAINAQEIATKTLQLSIEKHDLEKVSELRSRYSRAAEQLASGTEAVQWAGMYSLGSLADDWAYLGNKDEQQICISLLSSYLSSIPLEDSHKKRVSNSAFTEILLSRLESSGDNASRSWAKVNLRVDDLTFHRLPENMRVDGGNLEFGRCSYPTFDGLDGLEMVKGSLIFDQDDSKEPTIAGFADSLFKGGVVSVLLGNIVTDERLSYDNCLFEGGSAYVTSRNRGATTVVFNDCTFRKGTMTLNFFAGLNKVKFDGCRFESPEVVRISSTRESEVQVVFPGCEFLGEAACMEEAPAGWLLKDL